jgi:hypothetical protein
MAVLTSAGVSVAEDEHRPSDVVDAREPRTPRPPQRLTRSGLRPLDRAEAERLRGGSESTAVSCEIDFDDDAAIALLPNGAIDTFAYSPWWNQLCGGFYARVYPTDTNHLHLGYADDSIDVCTDPGNPHGTPVGTFSRGEDCEPIDPVTEPRSHINVGHYPNLHGRLDLIDPIGSDYKAQPFTLERVRILWAPAQVCYRMPPEGPWIAASGVLLGQPRPGLLGPLRVDGRRGQRGRRRDRRLAPRLRRLPPRVI